MHLGSRHVGRPMLTDRTRVQEEIRPSWRQDSQCHQDCGIPVQGQGAGTVATHHTRHHQKLIVEFADANYITIFDKEAVNIYDANDTAITLTRGAILRGFKCPMTGMWRIPLVDLVRNNNTDTVIVNYPPSEFLPARPSPADAIHNVYELKTQPELVRYYHAEAGFPRETSQFK